MVLRNLMGHSQNKASEITRIFDHVCKQIIAIDILVETHLGPSVVDFADVEQTFLVHYSIKEM